MSYIFILHQTTTQVPLVFPCTRCLISLFYIKPQLFSLYNDTRNGCLISLFYIKPQLKAPFIIQYAVVLYLYSTSNHNNNDEQRTDFGVVLYLYSTSNHNFLNAEPYCFGVVLYLYSTSNHNSDCRVFQKHMLSYIFILHQTTTMDIKIRTAIRLSYIFILHQTTTHNSFFIFVLRLSYIFILHQTTTSPTHISTRSCCLISLFYIKPQRDVVRSTEHSSCLISLFYIKPQHSLVYGGEPIVVLYLYSTSNHNRMKLLIFRKKLSYIFILHQTTTYISYLYENQYT